MTTDINIKVVVDGLDAYGFSGAQYGSVTTVSPGTTSKDVIAEVVALAVEKLAWQMELDLKREAKSQTKTLPGISYD